MFAFFFTSHFSSLAVTQICTYFVHPIYCVCFFLISPFSSLPSRNADMGSLSRFFYPPPPPTVCAFFLYRGKIPANSSLVDSHPSVPTHAARRSQQSIPLIYLFIHLFWQIKSKDRHTWDSNRSTNSTSIRGQSLDYRGGRFPLADAVLSSGFFNTLSLSSPHPTPSCQCLAIRRESAREERPDVLP